MRPAAIVSLAVMLAGVYVYLEKPIAACSYSVFGHCLVPTGISLLFLGYDPNVVVGLLLIVIGAGGYIGSRRG